MTESNTGEDRRDVVLITIDCWRTDAVSEMPRLRDSADEKGFNRARAVSHSAATDGAIPPLLASRHSVQAYGRDGQVRKDVRALPGVLREFEYSTAGIIGSNPFIAKWVRYFDHFWNDGMRVSMDYDSPRYSTADRVSRFLRLKQRVNATELTARARRWYQSTQSPRFLWMHLMDVHGPYFTGLRGAGQVGLFKTYKTLFDYHVKNRSTEKIRNRLHALYRQCVRQLDERITAVLDMVDSDAIVVLTGDHGEEFDHGMHGHARLYDECVTTPLFTKNIARPISHYDVRHIDLAPTILAELGIDKPPSWEGTPVNGTVRESLLSNHAPQLERSYVGLRTDQYKLIKSYHDQHWTEKNQELYCLDTDPKEQTTVQNTGVTRELETAIDSFLERNDMGLHVLQERSTGIDEEVEERLTELGYA